MEINAASEDTSQVTGKCRCVEKQTPQQKYTSQRWVKFRGIPNWKIQTGGKWSTILTMFPGFGHPADAPSASAAIFGFLHSCCQPVVCSVISARLGGRKNNQRCVQSGVCQQFSTKMSSTDLNTMVHAGSESLLLSSTFVVPGPVSSRLEMLDLPCFVTDTPVILW